MTRQVTVPALGESISEATLGEWLKKVGDPVAQDEPIASLETDKVALEVPAPVAGIIVKLTVEEGDTVELGALIAEIDEGASISVEAGDSHNSARENTNAQTDRAENDAGISQAHTTMSPSVRRLVLQHGVDPSQIKGSGKDGRLTKTDIEQFITNTKTAAAPAGLNIGGETLPNEEDTDPLEAFAGPTRHEEREKMSRLRQTIARRLKEAQDTAAILTTFNDIDMTAVIETRSKYKDLFAKKHGVRLGFMSFFTKAACLALKDLPAVNAYIEGNDIVYHNYVDISVAVSGPKGLVVPVIRNAETMSFADVEKTIADYGARAKKGELKMEEMQGGTFTISNGGVFGSLMSTPIINPPQSAVLGLHRIDQRPVVVDGEIVIRPMMYMALSYDHRLIDGREAVTFLVRIKEAIEDPARLLIDL